MNLIRPYFKRFSTYIKQDDRIVIITILIIAIILLILAYACGKTLWDWLDLVGIPVGLAIGLWLLGKKQADVEREIAKDKKQQEALQHYFDRMTELLLDYFQDNVDTYTNEKRKTIADIARWQTLTVLRAIDGRRKGQVLSFLYERGLISAENPFIDLQHAELMEADLIVGHPYHWGKKAGNGEWDDVTLSEYIRQNQENPRWGAKLEAVNLPETDLFGVAFVLTNLEKANFQGAYLAKALLMGANLRGADLCGADLRGANLTGADLTGAVYDQNTKLPDGFNFSDHGMILKLDPNK